MSFYFSNDVILGLLNYICFFLFGCITLFLVNSRKSKEAAFIAGLFFFWLILVHFMLDYFFKQLISNENPPFVIKANELYENLSPEGELKPNGTFHVIKKTPGGQLLEDIYYHTDSLGRRVTISSKNNSFDKHLLFFGESWVFGDDLPDSSTITSVLSQKRPSCKIINYGILAAGPQYMVKKLQEREFLKESLPSAGYAIYHLNYTTAFERLYGSLRTFRYSMGYNAVEINGSSIRLNGEVINPSDRMYRLLIFISENNLVKYFKINLPILSDYQYEQLTELIVKSSSLYTKQNPGGEFRVLFYPESKENTEGWQRLKILKKKLETRHIKVWDYSRLFDRERYMLPYLGHPNAQANHIIATQIIKDLHL